jgi:hypothetical protein
VIGEMSHTSPGKAGDAVKELYHHITDMFFRVFMIAAGLHCSSVPPALRLPFSKNSREQVFKMTVLQA